VLPGARPLQLPQARQQVAMGLASAESSYSVFCGQKRVLTSMQKDCVVTDPVWDVLLVQIKLV